MMPRPRILILEELSNGGVLLIGYSAEGVFAGDDWYATREEAEQAASEEYGTDICQWQEVDAPNLASAALRGLHAAREL